MARTLLGALLNKSPVPHAPSRRSFAGAFARSPGAGPEAQMRAMSSASTLHSIVSVVSNAVAQVDWKLWRTARSGLEEDRVEVTSHAALDLWRKPNPHMPRQEFVETFQQHLELTGEAWWVVGRHPRASVPLELWPVRPDRMKPVPHPTDFLSGYLYRSPDGEDIPLRLDEVVFLRMPNPLDPYRGMSPVQSVLADLDATRYSAEWNRNFFLNSAEPGGIIEVPHGLTDQEFEELQARWNEQHRGVANAHRVAILEHGQWKDRKLSQRDMQFVELRGVSRDVIREAYGMPAFALGDLDDVNRATALAAKAWFAEQITIPRLERIKQALNHELLPLFGATARGLEFDYCDPVPADPAAKNEELTAKANAAKALVEAGFYAPAVREALGLPEMDYGQPDLDPKNELLIDLLKRDPAQLAELILPMLGFDLPERPTPAPPPASPAPVEPGPEARTVYAVERLAITAATTPDTEALELVRQDHERALERLLADWQPIEDAWIEALGEQIEAAVDGEDTAALASLEVDSEEAASVLRGALAATAQQAAQRVADEAAAQGVNVTAPQVDEELTNRLRPGRIVNFGAELVDIAAAVAALLGGYLAGQAGQEALRRYVPGAAGRVIANAVKGALRSLKGVFKRDQLGGALHRATNVGRLATLEAAPPARWIATEVLDGNTCGPCRAIDGTVFHTLADAWAAYGTGPYVGCEGGVRCRGTVIAQWDTEGDGDA